MNHRKVPEFWKFSETYHVGFVIYNPVVRFFSMYTVHDIHIARRVADIFLCPDNPGMDILIVDTDNSILEVRRDGEKVWEV